MIPTQADVQRKPGLCPPVVLHVDVGLPEAEVLTLGIYLPLNLVWLALYEVHQIGELILGEPEVCQPERILIIIELPANHSAPELHVVRTLGPGQRALFLENVIDIQDGNKPSSPRVKLLPTARMGTMSI